MRHGRDGNGAAPIEVAVAGGVVTVSDRGPGLPSPILAGEGPPLRSGEVVGLGLSIAARVAEIHGGSLEAGPRAGGGASIRLVFPLPRDGHNAVHAGTDGSQSDPRT